MVEFDVEKLHVQVTPKNIKIIDSWKVTKKKDMKRIIKDIIYKAPIYNNCRSIRSLVREWRSHNIFYKMGWFVSHTKDCDLQSDEALYRRIVYFIVGRF